MELKPCPWCKSTAGVIITGSYVTCRVCEHSVAGGIMSWNSIPRTSQWTTYDGTQETLPTEECGVIVCINDVVQHAYVERFENTWCFGEDVDYVPCTKGDRWMYWPKGD